MNRFERRVAPEDGVIVVERMDDPLERVYATLVAAGCGPCCVHCTRRLHCRCGRRGKPLALVTNRNVDIAASPSAQCKAEMMGPVHVRSEPLEMPMLLSVGRTRSRSRLSERERPDMTRRNTAHWQPVCLHLSNHDHARSSLSPCTRCSPTVPSVPRCASVGSEEGLATHSAAISPHTPTAMTMMAVYSCECRARSTLHSSSISRRSTPALTLRVETCVSTVLGSC